LNNSSPRKQGAGPMREVGHYIDGAKVAGTSGRTADVYDPATGQVQAQVALADPAQVRAAIDGAETAQREWASWNPQRRARILMTSHRLVTERAEELAVLLSSEHGKTVA